MDIILSLIALIKLYWVVLLARVVLSWIAPGNYYQQPFKFIYDITEPFLAPLRRVIPPIGMIDISIMAAFFILGFVQFGLQVLHTMF